MTELDDIENDYLAIIESSRIVNIDLNRGSGSGMIFIGFAQWGWAPSSEPEQANRMRLLGRVRDFRPRFLLLFPHPTPQIEKRDRDALDLLERWLARKTATTRCRPRPVRSPPRCRRPWLI